MSIDNMTVNDRFDNPRTPFWSGIEVDPDIAELVQFRNSMFMLWYDEIIDAVQV